MQLKSRIVISVVLPTLLILVAIILMVMIYIVNDNLEVKISEQQYTFLNVDRIQHLAQKNILAILNSQNLSAMDVVINYMKNKGIPYQITSILQVYKQNEFIVDYSLNCSLNTQAYISTYDINFEDLFLLQSARINKQIVEIRSCSIQIKTRLKLLQQSETVLFDFIIIKNQTYLYVDGQIESVEINSLIQIDNSSQLQFVTKYDDNGCISGNLQEMQYYSNNQTNKLWFYQQPLQTLNQGCSDDSLVITYVFKLERVKLNLNISEEFQYFGYFTVFISLFIFIYVYIVGVRVAISLEGPLNQIKQILELDNQSFQDFVHFEGVKENNWEIIELLHFLHFVVEILHLNLQEQRIYDADNGAVYLYNLCQIKQIYKQFDNIWNVGLIANNIAIVHCQNERFMEAMNNMEESIVLGMQELTSITQLERIRKQIENKQNINLIDVILRLKRYVVNRFAGQNNNIQLEVIQNKNQQPHKSKQSVINKIINISQLNNIQSLESEQSELSEQYQSNIGNQRQQYKQSKYQIKITLFFRKYQLARMFCKYLFKGNLFILNEAIYACQSLYEEISYFSKTSRTLLIMRLLLLVRKFKCYFYANSISYCSEELTGMYNILKMLEQQDPDHIEYQTGINPFKFITIETLLNKVLFLDAQLKQYNNEHYESSLICAQILSNVHQMNFNALNKVYELLHQSFVNFTLNTEVVWNLFTHPSSIRGNSVVILIDYSNHISEEQLRISHSISKHILNQVSPQDEIGIFAFNETIFQILQFQRLANMKSIFSLTLDQTLIARGGNCHLLKAIVEAVNVVDQKQSFARKYQYHFEKRMRKSVQIGDEIFPVQTSFQLQADLHIKKIKHLCLFTEGNIIHHDNDLNIDYVRGLLMEKEVQLVVFNISNSKYNHRIMKQLCNYCNGILCEDEVQAFGWAQNLKQVKMKKIQQIEFQ